MTKSDFIHILHSLLILILSYPFFQLISFTLDHDPYEVPIDSSTDTGTLVLSTLALPFPLMVANDFSRLLILLLLVTLGVLVSPINY